MYIAFEGIIGTGKSTQAQKLHKYFQEKFPQRDVVLTREPGGSEVAEAIRHLVQAQSFSEEMDPTCETYLYAASRSQTLRTIVKPTIEKGGIVIADRCFVSSLANQGFGRELGLEVVLEIHKIAITNHIPDHIIYINLPIEIGLQRAFDEKGDKFESLGQDFYEKVENGYKEMQTHPLLKNHWININGNQPIEQVFTEILTKLRI